LFLLFLAGNAVACPRYSLQAFRINLIATAHALAKRAFTNPLQGRFHHVEQLPVVIADGEEKLLGIRVRRAVGYILRRLLVGNTAVFLRAAHCFAQRLLALFQPHLYSRTLHLAHEFAVALAAADAVCVVDVYPAREEPVEGVTGKLVVDELARTRPGIRVGWARTVEDGAALVAGWARAGDLVVTLGAGDVDQAVPLLLRTLGAGAAA